MKRLTCLTLTALFIILSTQPAKAPVGVFLGLALKCVGLGAIGSTAIILLKCEPDYYLVRYSAEGEETYWSCSQASARTLAKTGGVRCEGPWKDRAEPDMRAWANNHDPEHPMFPCGPLGAPLPNATWTNYSIVSLQHSINGQTWRSAGNVIVAQGESNWAVCLLGPTGTNGMTLEKLREVAECDVVIPNGLPAAKDIKDYRVRGFCSTLTSGTVSQSPAKRKSL